MEVFDLGIAWNWQPDTDFINELNEQSLKSGLRPYLIHIYNLYGTLKDIAEGNISFKVFFDRTSGDDPVFSGLSDFIKPKVAFFINHPDIVKRAVNKFLMHFEFINQKIPVPLTVTLNPQDDNQTLELKIKDLPKPFVLKPADGAAGEGVVLDARSLDDIQRLKEDCDNTTYLAQDKVSPLNLGDRPGWFRVFYCSGEIIPCWWDPLTHIYNTLSQDDIYRFRLADLWRITKGISEVCRLDFFSTEIAIKNDKKFVVIDYVNDQCDMRKKSKFNDGLPDEVVGRIVENIISFVKQKQKGGEQR